MGEAECSHEDHVRRRVAAHEGAAVLLEQAAELHKAAMTVFRTNGRPDLAEREAEIAARTLRTAADQRTQAAAERDQ